MLRWHVKKVVEGEAGVQEDVDILTKSECSGFDLGHAKSGICMENLALEVGQFHNVRVYDSDVTCDTLKITVLLQTE